MSVLYLWIRSRERWFLYLKQRLYAHWKVEKKKKKEEETCFTCMACNVCCFANLQLQHLLFQVGRENIQALGV